MASVAGIYNQTRVRNRKGKWALMGGFLIQWKYDDAAFRYSSLTVEKHLQGTLYCSASKLMMGRVFYCVLALIDIAEDSDQLQRSRARWFPWKNPIDFVPKNGAKQKTASQKCPPPYWIDWYMKNYTSQLRVCMSDLRAAARQPKLHSKILALGLNKLTKKRKSIP